MLEKWLDDGRTDVKQRMPIIIISSNCEPTGQGAYVSAKNDEHNTSMKKVAFEYSFKQVNFN